MKCKACEEKELLISELNWRLRNPYRAFLEDAAKKDNCRNCANNKGACPPPNSDSVYCDYVIGWPDWTTKCRNWTHNQLEKGDKNDRSISTD